MLQGLLVLLGMQLAGTVLAMVTNLPLPGPVLGMLLMLIWCIWRHQVSPNLRSASTLLLDHLALLFVPAGVGVIAYWQPLMQHVWGLSLILVAGMVVTMLTTAWTLHFLLGRDQKKLAPSVSKEPES